MDQPSGRGPHSPEPFRRLPLGSGSMNANLARMNRDLKRVRALGRNDAWAYDQLVFEIVQAVMYIGQHGAEPSSRVEGASELKPASRLWLGVLSATAGVLSPFRPASMPRITGNRLRFVAEPELDEALYARTRVWRSPQATVEYTARLDRFDDVVPETLTLTQMSAGLRRELGFMANAGAQVAPAAALIMELHGLEAEPNRQVTAELLSPLDVLSGRPGVEMAADYSGVRLFLQRHHLLQLA